MTEYTPTCYCNDKSKKMEAKGIINFNEFYYSILFQCDKCKEYRIEVTKK